MKQMKIIFTLLCCFFFQLSDAQYNITGKVVNESGVPLQNVSAEIKKSKAGILTDADGMFILRSDEPSPKVFISYVGYDPATIKMKNGETVIITLHQREVLLSDVQVNAFEGNSDVRN